VLEDELMRPEAIQHLVACVGDADRASASNVLAPLIRMLSLKRLNRALGHSGMPSKVLLRLKHPEAVVRKDALQVIILALSVSILSPTRKGTPATWPAGVMRHEI
jgi:hypothetical protein